MVSLKDMGGDDGAILIYLMNGKVLYPGAGVKRKVVKEESIGGTGEQVRARRRITSPFDTAIFPLYFVVRWSRSPAMLPPHASSSKKIARLKRETYFSPAPKCS